MSPIYEMHTHKMWENSRIEMLLVVSLTGKISNDFFFKFIIRSKVNVSKVAINTHT